MDHRPIGVFDSGVGGLTVARELFRRLPQESVLYVGDTARVPYGPRGAEIIHRFALELAEFLLARNVKALVIACNTVSATAADAIRLRSPVPVYDVVAPTVRAAVQATSTGVIGVIGTVSTVQSGIYETLAAQLQPGVRVLVQPCPLFVPIAEENLARHAVARLMADEYLGVFAGSGLDTLILGCTHYPLLRSVIGEAVDAVVGHPVRLVDSAAPTIAALEAGLTAADARSSGPARHRFFVTDASYKFMQVAQTILDRDVSTEVAPLRLSAGGVGWG